MYTPLPRPYFTSFFRFTVVISLSGDGKALSFFLNESVQQKDRQHLFKLQEFTVDVQRTGM